MSSISLAAVALGAAAGAPIRYLVDLAITARVGNRFPWGTLMVNLLGTALFGLLTGLAVGGHVPPRVLELLGVGFCGAFTTTSAFAWEIVSLGAAGAQRRAAVYVALSAGAGLVLATGAFALGLAV